MKRMDRSSRGVRRIVIAGGGEAPIQIPDSLRHRIELFREMGRVFRVPNELFAENAWIQFMLSQGIEPGDAELIGFLEGIRTSIERTVSQLPDHQAHVEQYCKAPPMGSLQG
jgi:tryptophan halogenase